MDRTLTQLRQHRAPLRRWLALCVMVFASQTAAPALTWCLHGGDVAVHGEAVVFDLPGHAAAMDHCAHHATDHRMFEASDPGTAASVAPVVAAAAGPALIARLPALDFASPSPAGAALARRETWHSGHPPDTPCIEHLAGATTRLLI